MATEKANAPEAMSNREDRIKQLAGIEENVTKLLRAAGEALQALTNQPTEKEGQAPPSDAEARAAFETATSRYFSLLSSVDVSIRRQIWALEEANIIAPAPSEKDKDGQIAKEKTAADAASLGNLNVGWLNSRNDKVGKEMEAELWEKARSLMAAATSRKEGNDQAAEEAVEAQ